MARLSLGDRLMLIFASRKVHPLGDPCDKLSDDQPNGDWPAVHKDFVGERISHSTDAATALDEASPGKSSQSTARKSQ